jgi:uncharacterized protein (DUF488 family)
MLNLYTIGYEGADLNDVMEILAGAGVSLVADIRERPQSRKPGFSKLSLQNALAQSRIAYQHFGDLGDPKDGRMAARAGDYALFREIYLRQMVTPAARLQLALLRQVAQTQATCLLCFEKEPVGCHRTIVADYLAKDGFRTVNLFADRNLVEHGVFKNQQGSHTRQSPAAT